MTFCVENEIDKSFDFDIDDIISNVMETVLDMEKCPYEATVNVLITDSDGIQMINKEFRDIDKPTDVLSFPNVAYETEADFEHIDEESNDIFDPDTGELVLGDIVLNYDRIISQAQEYGHSIRREFAFLVTHSMFHLCGYDHMTPEEAAVMEEKQRKTMEILNITRD